MTYVIAYAMTCLAGVLLALLGVKALRSIGEFVLLGVTSIAVFTLVVWIGAH